MEIEEDKMAKEKFFVMTAHFDGSVSYSWVEAKSIEEAYEILDESSESNSVSDWVLEPKEVEELKEFLK